MYTIPYYRNLGSNFAHGNQPMKTNSIRKKLIKIDKYLYNNPYHKMKLIINPPDNIMCVFK